MNRVNHPKNKIAQLFCKHKNKGWYKMTEKYSCISGERRYLICEDCGKIFTDCFLKYEGFGFK